VTNPLKYDYDPRLPQVPVNLSDETPRAKHLIPLVHGHRPLQFRSYQPLSSSITVTPLSALIAKIRGRLPTLVETIRHE
jgi:hypothetical protein